MKPLIAQSLLASAVFTAAFGSWLVFEVWMTCRRLPARSSKRRDRGSAALIFGSVCAAFVLMNAIAVHAARVKISTSPWIVFGIGIAFSIAGFTLRLLAIRALGRSFIPLVATSPNQAVVESGPYRFIRHPSYSGALVILLGAALTFGNWLSLLAIVPPVVAYVYRSSVEEKVLKDDLGRAYQDYCRRTKRFVPFVY